MKYADSEYDALSVWRKPEPRKTRNNRRGKTRSTNCIKNASMRTWNANSQFCKLRFSKRALRKLPLPVSLMRSTVEPQTSTGARFAVGQERQLFTNAASPLILGATRFLGSAIPGQTDAAGNPTDIGNLFHGTLLDSANADPARQTAANHGEHG